MRMVKLNRKFQVNVKASYSKRNVLNLKDTLSVVHKLTNSSKLMKVQVHRNANKNLELQIQVKLGPL